MEFQSILKIVLAFILIFIYLFAFYNIYETYKLSENDKVITPKEEIENLKKNIEGQTNKETIPPNNNMMEMESDKKNNAQSIETIKNNPIFNLTDYERWVVECIVMGESGGEPYEGQMLVAQCILNACLKDDIMPSEVREKYKYSGWNENPTDNVKNVVSAVFDLGEKITNEPILYFYAPSLCQSKWHETQIFIIECGGHRFFKEKQV